MSESAFSILIVDDDRNTLALLSGILSDEGYHVRAADSGRLALAALESAVPDLILLDLRMPGMDGLEVLCKLKMHERASEVPVIFISGSAETAGRVEGLRLGAVDFVIKPCQRDELLARIRTHLELSGLRYHLEEQVAQRTDQLQSTVQLLQREIEARALSERALRESEARFRTMADTAPVMIVTTNAAQEANFFNRTWLEFTGRSMEQEAGFGWTEGVHPDDKQASLTSIGTSFTGRKICELEYRVRRADGQYRTLMCKGLPRYEADGAFVGYIASMVDITELREYQGKLRALSASLISAQEEERRRISRELHDDLIQRLAMLAVGLGMLAARQSDAHQITELRRLQQLAVEYTELTRHIAHELHPLLLDDLGIVIALRSLCDLHARRQEICVNFESSDLPLTMNREVGSCIYAVTQEALRNVAKHAQASVVNISLVGREHLLVLAITDDGVGFNTAATESVAGMGLVNMRERVRWTNGTFSVSSEPQQGTKITVEVPSCGRNVAARAQAHTTSVAQ